MLREFRGRFWQPPRAHGDVIEDRTVSFLELFYDLTYVVVIAAAADTLAHDISLQSAVEFAVVFGMIWVVWISGTMLYDLHGREDIRTRTYTFAQMLLIVLLAVYIGDAAGEGGRGFALVLAALLGLQTWLWFTVRRQDDEQYAAIISQYMVLLIISITAILISAFLDSEGRIWIWSLFLVMWLMTLIVVGRRGEQIVDQSSVATDSLVERFGLFTIIVLGEVVVGVAAGLSNAVRDFETVATGLLALNVGFGIWWNYFDLTGGRLPRQLPGGSSIWMAAQLPWTMSIAAAGAAMVSMIEHAGDDRAPITATWLLTGSTALGLVSLAIIIRALEDYQKLKVVFQPTSRAMLVAAGGTLVVGVWRPAPLLLVVVLSGVLSWVWFFAVSRWLTTEEGTRQLA